MTKLNNLNCDGKNPIKYNCETTQIVTEIEKLNFLNNSKNQIVTKLKNPNGDKTLKTAIATKLKKLKL